MFDTWRSKIGRSILRKFLAKTDRQVYMSNLFSAKSVGIVYDLSEPRNLDKIKNYVRYLQSEGGKQVMTMGFIDEKSVPDQYLSKIDFSYFCRADLNWYGRPGGIEVENFMAKGYDILIDFSRPGLLPAEFLVGITKAGFKVGQQSRYATELYDLSLSVKEDGLVYLIKQVDHYLKMINSGQSHA